MTRRTSGWRRASPYLLAGLLTTTGTLHFVATRQFRAIVPRRLPARTTIVHVSGAAELACAAGLALPRTRRRAAWLTAGLFVAVFPANVQMAWDWRHRATPYRAAALARLPVQLPLVAWAVSVARVSRPRSTGRAGRRPTRAGGRGSSRP